MRPRVRRDLTTGILIGFLLLSLWMSPTHAGTIYSYLDDQGNLHATDSPDTIPEKYRAKVQTYEQADPTVTPPSKFEAAKQAVVETVKRLGVSLPTMKKGSAPNVGAIQFSGISPSQSQILTYAAGAAFGLLIMMYLSKGPMVRMLGLCLLVVLGIGTPVLMYVSEDGPADILKQKAVAAGQAQQDRLKPAGQ